MAQVIRWGILGASKFAREQMAPAIHAAQGAELAALATSSPEKAAQFQAFCPGLRLHDSYQALLADPNIEAVYIPLPNHMHAEWVEKTLRAGKAALCEKPIAMRAGEIDRLIALRDETGLLAAEAYMIVHHPQWQRARDLIADGAIGELVHVAGHFSYDNRADTGNIRNRPETGGGGIRDIGVYPYGATRFATGQEPREVSALIRRENDVDTYAQVRADFDGFTGVFTVSMRMNLYQEMAFHGDKGVLRLPAPFNPGTYGEARLELRRGAGEIITERFPGMAQYVLQVENFGHTLRDGVDYPCPLEFSRGTQAMIDRIFEVA